MELFVKEAVTHLCDFYQALNINSGMDWGMFGFRIPISQDEFLSIVIPYDEYVDTKRVMYEISILDQNQNYVVGPKIFVRKSDAVTYVNSII